MGNSESNESAAVKRQAEGANCPMYELVDLQGGGSLFWITKRAMVKKDYKELDEAIKSKVPPFCYNNGKGAMVPTVQLAMMRNRDRPKSKQFQVIKDLGEEAFDYVFEGSELLAKVTKDMSPETHPHLYRECCWMVEKRGNVGETAFHICFLIQSTTHLVLGRRLLKWYPKLINDVYLSEEYYGENALHFAIVSEDPQMVKFLLENGVEIHERCYGNFFCPDDQRPSRTDSMDHEIVDVCLKTNYLGYVAWGEYPLSFAGVLEQEECYRLVLSKGANHDLQDSNGNTVTHILVVFDKMKMFDMAVECGAAINILNKQNLTPLTVAAFLARQEMFFHIANVEREVYWQIGNVCCSAYPIEQLDSINSQTGELNPQSALNLIVFGLRTEHLDLIEGVVVDLLQVKWRTFIRRVFFHKLYAFTVYFIISTLVFYIKPSKPPDGFGTCGLNDTNVTLANNKTVLLQNLTSLFTEESMSTVNTTSTSLFLEYEDEEDIDPMAEMIRCNTQCYLHTYTTYDQQIRGIGEIILIIWSILYILQAVREFMILGRKIWLETMALSQSRCLFLIGCCLLLFMVPFRFACQPQIENRLTVGILLFTGLHFLFFCRGFKLTGPFVIMIYRMAAADLLRFVTIYVVFVMGFSPAYYIIFQSHDSEEENPLETPVESIIAIFRMSLGSFGNIYEALDDTRSRNLGRIHMFIFMCIVFILLVNLLIAMMGDTYNKIAEIKNEWMRQWARMVLIVERGIPPKERLRQQNLYSERMATGEKALVMKQTMSEEQLEEIKEIVEMKVTHRKNINRRKDKFGYESNSTIGYNLTGVQASIMNPDGEDDDENPYG